MDSAVGQTGGGRFHWPAMPWGLVVGLEVLVAALGSAMLVLGVIPAAFDVEWGCVTSKGDTHTAADTYVATFAVLGALGWIVAAGATTLLYASGRLWLALATPAAWFGLIVGTSLLTVSAIGPLPC